MIWTFHQAMEAAYVPGKPGVHPGVPGEGPDGIVIATWIGNTAVATAIAMRVLGQAVIRLRIATQTTTRPTPAIWSRPSRSPKRR